MTTVRRVPDEKEATTVDDELLDEVKRLFGELRDAENELDSLGAWRPVRPVAPGDEPRSPDNRDWPAIENTWQRRDELEEEIITLLHL